MEWEISDQDIESTEKILLPGQYPKQQTGK